jgi:hypothetical protein
MNNMKKYLYNIMFAFVGILALTGCKEEKGTEPGTDSKPVVTVYQYAAQLPLSSDNDCIVRVAANSSVESAYYLAEKADEKTGRNMTADAYADYVISNGKKIDNLSAGNPVDLAITDMMGDYIITVVGVKGNTKYSTETAFKGLDWRDMAKGTYYFAKPKATGKETAEATLQYCANVDGLYRIKDVFGPGYSLKFTGTGSKGSNKIGNYEMVRVAAQKIGYTYGSYGEVSIRDVATWQNSDDYLDNQIYESGYCSFWVQYFVSAGSLGYGYDEFVPE